MEETNRSSPETENRTVVVKRYVKYTFFKLAREWKFLDENSKEASKSEFLKILSTIDPQSINLNFFSLVGIRGDADFMVLADSSSLEPFQSLISKLCAARFGGYLTIPYSYLAMTRRSPYLGDHRHTGQEGGSSTRPEPGSKYLFVYPFTKKREWYRLPFHERQRMMAEHFRVGHKYPNIKINTGYSFGLDDQEFMLGFEGDDPSEFLALVEELRSSEASMYTEMETPIFTCARVSAERMLELIG